MHRQFANPSNGHVETSSGSFSWLWVFLFGIIYFLVKGNFKHAAVCFFTFGLAQLVYPFMIKSVNANWYLNNGWKEVKPAYREATNTQIVNE